MIKYITYIHQRLDLTMKLLFQLGINMYLIYKYKIRSKQNQIYHIYLSKIRSKHENTFQLDKVFKSDLKLEN